jgi:putative DNA primase/helicase
MVNEFQTESKESCQAAVLRSRGFALCRPDPGTKKPTYRGWSTRSLEPHDFAAGHLLGVLGGPLSNGNRPGHATVILDLDKSPVIAKADDFLAATGMEDGRRSKPRSHRFFLIPFATIPPWAESTAPQAAKAAKAATGHPGPFLKHFQHKETGENLLDFIGTGGQVVVPPSRHPSGEIREWSGGEPGEPAVVEFGLLWDVTVQLALACGWERPATGETFNDRHGTASNSAPKDASTIHKRVLAYLNTCPPSISEHGGHHWLMWAARAVVYGFDLGIDAGFQVLWDSFNPRCKPPWSEREIRHKCEEVDRLPFNKERGWLLREKNPRWKEADFAGGNGPARENVVRPDIHLTDLGNARRVVARHGQDLRYCHPWKSYLCYDGKRWLQDATGEAVWYVKNTQAEMYGAVAEKIKLLGDVGDDWGRKNDLTRLAALLKHALKWEDGKRITASLELVRSEPGIPILPDQMDTDHFLLNCPNGSVDLRTGQLREHKKEDYLTGLCPVAYNPKAEAPRFQQFLVDIFKWPAFIRYMQRLLGYCLTGDVREQILPIFWGSGANGKSTLINLVLAVLGEDYAIKASRDLFMVRKADGHPAQIARLFGKRVVVATETQEGGRLDEGLVKELTGGDKMAARRMRENWWQFSPTHKAILVTNHKQEIRGTDHAIWRRIRLVPFEVSFSEGQQDKKLPGTLLAEAPGVLAWLVRGCLDWQNHGLISPDPVVTATRDYRNTQDIVEQFIEERCLTGPDYRQKSGELYANFKGWCLANGEEELSQRRFGESLRERGLKSYTSNGTWYRGIALKPLEQEQPFV